MKLLNRLFCSISANSLSLSVLSTIDSDSLVDSSTESTTAGNTISLSVLLTSGGVSVNLVLTTFLLDNLTGYSAI